MHEQYYTPVKNSYLMVTASTIMCLKVSGCSDARSAEKDAREAGVHALGATDKLVRNH